MSNENVSTQIGLNNQKPRPGVWEPPGGDEAQLASVTLVVSWSKNGDIDPDSAFERLIISFYRIFNNHFLIAGFYKAARKITI